MSLWNPASWLSPQAESAGVSEAPALEGEQDGIERTANEGSSRESTREEPGADPFEGRILEAAGNPGVERVAVLDEIAGRFCGRNDGEREEFALSIREIAVGGKTAAKRMGLGPLRAVVLENTSGQSIVLSLGRKCAGAQAGADCPPEFLLSLLHPLSGTESSGRKS